MESHPLRYSLRQLRYFVVTAEALSFTAAAKRLHISQPSISTALADLESSFGVQLFIRHHASGLSLTQAGRDLLGQARNLLKIAEELQTSAKEMDGGMTGSIALGCLVSLARSRFAECAHALVHFAALLERFGKRQVRHAIEQLLGGRHGGR